MITTLTHSDFDAKSKLMKLIEVGYLFNLTKILLNNVNIDNRNNNYMIIVLLVLNKFKIDDDSS